MWRTLLPVLCAAFVLLTAGCTGYAARPLTPADEISAFEARSLHDPGLKAFLQQNLGEEAIRIWPLPYWDLPALTLAALYYHPDLKVAQAKWEAAEAGRITAGMRPNPSLGTTAQYNANDETRPWTWDFSLEVPVETAGKRTYRLVQAEALARAARLNVMGTMWQVRSAVRTSFVDLYAAREREALLQRQQEVQADIVRLLEKRLAAGLASEPETSQARIALNQTRLALGEARQQGAEAQARLATAVGVPLRALSSIDLSFIAWTQVPAELDLGIADLRRAALTQRADVLASLAEYAARDAALRLEIARQYPDIRIGPGYSWDAGVNKWLLGVSLELPVLNRNEGPIAEAQAQRTLAAASFDALQTRILGEIDEALAGYRAAVHQLATADALVMVQQRLQAASAAQFKAGETDRLALATAQGELAVAEFARFNALVAVQQTLGRLEAALQHPLPPQVPQPLPGIHSRMENVEP